MSKPYLRDKVMPTKFAGTISTDWFRKFTLKERLQILFGYNLSVAVRIVCVHAPGKFNPIIAAETTKHTEPSEQITDRLKNVLAEQNAAKIVQ